MTDTHSGLSLVGPIVVLLVGFFLLQNFSVAISMSPHVVLSPEFYAAKIMNL